ERSHDPALYLAATTAVQESAENSPAANQESPTPARTRHKNAYARKYSPASPPARARPKFPHEGTAPADQPSGLSPRSHHLEYTARDRSKCAALHPMSPVWH